MQQLNECLENIYVEKWEQEINRDGGKNGKGKNKLRTYRLFKIKYVSEFYVFTIMPKGHRSALAPFRCATAPLRIETGRYENLSVEERKCLYCKDVVEDESHVLLDCPLYNDIRCKLFKQLQAQQCNLLCLNKIELLRTILASQEEYTSKCSAKTCSDILRARREYIYKQPPP